MVNSDESNPVKTIFQKWLESLSMCFLQALRRNETKKNKIWREKYSTNENMYINNFIDFLSKNRNISQTGLETYTVRLVTPFN